jgi:acetyl esterase
MNPVRDATIPRLHPQLDAVRRERIAAGMRPQHELTVPESRAAEAAALPATTREPGLSEFDRSIPGPSGRLRLRLYVPERHAEPHPVLVFFFGGGWVIGSIEASAPVCRRLALATPCAVAAVDYRRAPEHPFPAAVQDGDAAALWVAEHAGELGLDRRTIAVGGISAGGNLATAVARLARDRGEPHLSFQLLVYPPTDARADTPSLRENADPVFFTRETIAWCWSHYLARESDRDDPLASPLRAGDPSGLPPALVITAELDPLRDEGERYAERLAAAGVPVELVRFDGMVHGFFSMTGVVDAAAEAQALAAASVARAFARSAR